MLNLSEHTDLHSAKVRVHLRPRPLGVTFFHRVEDGAVLNNVIVAPARVSKLTLPKLLPASLPHELRNAFDKHLKNRVVGSRCDRGVEDKVRLE